MSKRSIYLKSAQELQHNEGQWAAYESEGHCVVLAGPGSGKTKTLTIKLARILAEDVEEPRGIACITYSNECAKELEKRLSLLGVEPDDRLFIGTVHSFSLTQIILPYAKVATMGLPDPFKIATQQEQRSALERAYQYVIGRDEDPHRVWKLRVDSYRRTHLDRTADSIFHNEDPDCARLVLAYERELRARGLIDFDDMPLISLRALKEHCWLREAIKAKYPVFAVDEYQDLGVALHKMVLGLCFKTGIRLIAVGDVDQSIYGFTGAKPQLLEKLSQRTEVETVNLRLNYRSGSNIVTASEYVLDEVRNYQTPDGTPEGLIHFHPVRNDYEAQGKYVFQSLLPDAVKRIPDLQLGEIAVLYPAAWIGDSVNAAAQLYGCSVIRSDTNAIYPRSSRVLRWLEQCASWCCIGWQSGDPSFSKIVTEAYRLFNEALIKESDKHQFQQQLISMLFSNRDESSALRPWLIDITQLLKPYFSVSRTLQDEKAILKTFIRSTQAGESSEGLTLGQFCGYGSTKDRLHLSSLHSSKGREFRLVILFGMDNGRLPWRNANNQQLREARRLFYVGLTRAKEEVHIVYSSHNPSPFVTELEQRIDAA